MSEADWDPEKHPQFLNESVTDMGLILLCYTDILQQISVYQKDNTPYEKSVHLDQSKHQVIYWRKQKCSNLSPLLYFMKSGSFLFCQYLLFGVESHKKC